MLRPGLWAALCVLVLGLVVGIATDGTPNIGLCLPDREDSFRITEHLQEIGLEACSVQDENLSQVAALVVNDPTMAEQLYFPQMPAIYVDIQPAGKDAYIGGDAAQAGRLQAQMLLATASQGDWNEDGVVTCYLLGARLTRPDMQAWGEAIRKTLEEAGLKPEIIGSLGTGISREQGKLVCGEALADYGRDLEVIFAYTDALTLGALDAVTDSGRTVDENITLLGAGRSQATAEQAQQGIITGYAGMDEAAFVRALQQELTRAAGGAEPRSWTLPYTAYPAA